MNFEVKFLGMDNDFYRWNVTINGQNFDYFTGLGHATRKKQDNSHKYKYYPKNRTDATRVIKGLDYMVKSVSLYDADNMIRLGVFLNEPTLNDVLYCLFLDSDVIEYDFEDWCNNFGYSNDSIKAKNAYKLCFKNYYKLKKALGSNYETLKSEVTNDNL